MATELHDTDLFERQEMILDEYLAFISDGLRFAISARYVTEIITSFFITVLPGVPGFIKGIFNLRGQVIPIVDARIRMRQSPNNGDEPGRCVIVLNSAAGEVAIGLLVDGVSHVINIRDEEILVPPANNRQELVSGIVHIGEDDYMIMDFEKLLER